MAIANSENQIRNILVLSAKVIPENELGHLIKLFPNISDLNEYIYNHIKDTNAFDLHIPSTHLEELIRTDVQKLKQVRCICVYYDTDQARQTGQNDFESGPKEAEIFKFCVGRVFGGQLENAETGGAVQWPGAINHRTIHNVIASIRERVRTKRKNNFDCHSPGTQQIVSTGQNASFINNINRRFICPFCKTIFQEPYQLECGHRLCQSCLISLNYCPRCSELIAKEKAWFDRAFEKEKQHLLTTCLVCKWEGPFQFYPEHVRQNHPKDPIPNEQIAQNSFHQETPSALRLERLVNNSNINNSHIQDTMSGLLNTVNDLNDRISGREMNSNLLYQEHLPLQERVADAQLVIAEVERLARIPEIPRNDDAGELMDNNVADDDMADDDVADDDVADDDVADDDVADDDVADDDMADDDMADDDVADDDMADDDISAAIYRFDNPRDI